MKKLIAATALALLAGSAFAAATVIANGDVITNTQCAYVPTSNAAGVKLSISNNVAAAYECTSTGVVTGAAHTQGKKHTYISTSAGGSQQIVDTSANPATITTSITSDSATSTLWNTLVGALT